MCCAPGALDVQEEEIMFPLKRATEFHVLGY